MVRQFLNIHVYFCSVLFLFLMRFCSPIFSRSMRDNQWNGDFISDDSHHVCCKFYCFAYNVSKNKIFYQKSDRHQHIQSELASDRHMKVKDAEKFNSIYCWLVDFSLYFLLSPTDENVYLPFRQKYQVYDFYRLAVQRQKGIRTNIFISILVGIRVPLYSWKLGVCVFF